MISYQIPTYVHTGLKAWTVETQLYFPRPNPAINDRRNCSLQFGHVLNKSILGTKEGSNKRGV